jgi:hypothetical protein
MELPLKMERKKEQTYNRVLFLIYPKRGYGVTPLFIQLINLPEFIMITPSNKIRQIKSK